MAKRQPEAAVNESEHLKSVKKYVASVVSGKKIAGKETLQACLRFNKDLKNPAYEFRTEDAEFVINVIETSLVHKKGEALDGSSLVGKPLLLQPWQKFIIYNLLGFFIAGTAERRYKEAFIYVPRKNGKTTFIAALAWGLALLSAQSGATVYIVGAALRQAMQSFEFLLHNLRHMGEFDNFRVLNNNSEHSISYEFADDEGNVCGSIHIEALASNPDAHDSLNCNIAIADELHAYRSPKNYNVIFEAMEAYTNKLMIGITTAGDNRVSFCYRRLTHCQSVLNSECSAEQLFIFIAKADEDEKGNVDYTSEEQHEKANPSYGITIRPNSIMASAIDAQNDPQQRKDFLAKHLNVYTSATRAYFNLHDFQASDRKYNWTLEELAKLPVRWYGGTDLAKQHDLCAAALVGLYGDVLIIISHGWFPIVAARQKAEDDSIPLFGWESDGILTMTNSEITNHAEIVKWYVRKRKYNFKISQVGHDRKFCREYYIAMKKAGFHVVDQPQLFVKKSEGFRYIEAKAKAGLLYYLHSEAFEYCIENVHAIEKTDDMIMYEKIMPENRIDYFDAGVFATVRMLENMEEGGEIEEWFN